MRITSNFIFASFVLSSSSVFAAPAVGHQTFEAQHIAGRYIVSYKTDTFSVQKIDELETKKGYTTANGYVKLQMDGLAFRTLSGKFSKEEVEAFKNDPMVEAVEQEQIYRTVDTVAESYRPTDIVAKLYRPEFITQRNSTWGLGRISHLGTGPWSDFNYLTCDTKTYSYIIDTGIYLEHEDFEGRASWGTNTLDDIDIDTEGHGTHVAGTIIGRTWGIAKNGEAIAVKVLNGYGGSTTSVVAGVVWAYNDAKAKGRLAVSSLNASLGGNKSLVLNNAFTKAHNDGLFVVVAAGNQQSDVKWFSPASADNITVVASINEQDSRSWFSNFGERVDIFAPGSNIRSASISGKKASELKSGTSMASPHVAGLVAYYQCAFKLKAHKDVVNKLKSCSAKGYVKDGQSLKINENVATNCIATAGGTSPLPGA